MGPKRARGPSCCTSLFDFLFGDVSSKRDDADVLVREWIETAHQGVKLQGQKISAQDSVLRKSESMSMSSGVSYARVLSQLLIFSLSLPFKLNEGKYIPCFFFISHTKLPMGPF